MAHPSRIGHELQRRNAAEFPLGVEDAAILGKHYAPEFTPADLLNLPNRSFYLRLMIDGGPAGRSAASCCPIVRNTEQSLARVFDGLLRRCPGAVEHHAAVAQRPHRGVPEYATVLR